MANKEDIAQFQEQLKDATAQEVVNWALETFDLDKLTFASSMGAEDQVLTDMVLKANKEANIFTLDTGRLHQETHNVIEKTMDKYGVSIEILSPEREDLEKLVAKEGPNLFYKSIENRKLCCKIRKVDVLKRKLATQDAWICGLRASQSVTRVNVHKVDWDDNFGIVKINPLADWSEEDVWNYIKEHDIPYNELHDKGFPSIGCAPCTRAIKPGEDVRAGRWWWEEPEKKECGLHLVDGKLVRRNG